MTKKDMKTVKKIVERIVNEMIYQPDEFYLQDEDEAMFSILLLQEIEDYLGEPVYFMGIS